MGVVKEIQDIAELFKKEGRAIKDAKTIYAITAIIIAVCCYLFTDHEYTVQLKNKDATIKSDEATIKTDETDRDSAFRQRDELAKQVAFLKANPQTARESVKIMALNCASRIHAFIADWKDGDPPGVQWNNVRRYADKFGAWASLTRDDLEKAGQSSKILDDDIFNFFQNQRPSTIKSIADEIERLANELPD